MARSKKAQSAETNTTTGITGYEPRERKPIENRIDALLIFDVKNGNPNQEPESGGRAREIFEYGAVSNGCIKRKLRDYISIAYAGQAHHKIFIKRRAIMNLESRKWFQEKLGIEKADKVGDKKLAGMVREVIDADEAGYEGIKYFTDEFLDLRWHGGPLTVFKKANLESQITGPVQITDAQSVDPIYQQPLTITRCSVNDEDAAKEKDTEMGTRYIVPYGLYVSKVYVNPSYARVTGFGETDLAELFEGLENMFEVSRSASNGTMTTRKLVIFRHDSALGNAHSESLFDLVKIEKKPGVLEPRRYSDYDISVDLENVPAGVTCEVRSF